MYNVQKARDQRKKLLDKLRLEGRMKLEGKSKEWIQKRTKLWRDYRVKGDTELEEEEKEEEK